MAENDGPREVFPRLKRLLNAILKVFINRQAAWSLIRVVFAHDRDVNENSAKSS